MEDKPDHHRRSEDSSFPLLRTGREKECRKPRSNTCRSQKYLDPLWVLSGLLLTLGGCNSVPHHSRPGGGDFGTRNRPGQPNFWISRSTRLFAHRVRGCVMIEWDWTNFFLNLSGEELSSILPNLTIINSNWGFRSLRFGEFIDCGENASSLRASSKLHRCHH